jgi:hypothetical protein
MLTMAVSFNFINQNETETKLIPTIVLQILDEWRKQSGYKYPAGLEKA